MYAPLYRHLLLPAFDRLKGRRTFAYWERFEQTQWLSAEKHEKGQFAALHDLLAHAFATCPWYREQWQELGLSLARMQSLRDFQHWPLVTREDIAAHRTQMRSTLPMRLISKSTGGSSGVPLAFDLNSDSNDRRTAMMWRGYRWGGGEPGTRQLFVWGGALQNTPLWKRCKLALHTAFDNRRVINCFEFTPGKMARHAETLDRFRPDAIIAYTTPLYEFARYLEETGRTVRPPKSILVGAEKLHDFQRLLIERVLGAPVFETYGSREFMLIGAECEHHAGLHLSQENLLVEILDDDGRATPAGDEGNVVITDLFNFGMPFIRYVNGDRAVAGFEQCPCGRGLPLLKKVTGRTLDTLETPDGRKVPGELFPHLLKDFPAVRRFQVVQSDPRTIRVKLVAPQLSHDDREFITAGLRAVTGWMVDLEVEVVDDIPLTKAGKLRVVVRGSPDPALPTTAGLPSIWETCGPASVRGQETRAQPSASNFVNASSGP